MRQRLPPGATKDAPAGSERVQPDRCRASIRSRPERRAGTEELPSRIYISVGRTSRETRSVAASALRVCAACQASAIASKRSQPLQQRVSSRTRPSARSANGSRYVLGPGAVRRLRLHRVTSCEGCERVEPRRRRRELGAADQCLAGASDSRLALDRVRSPRMSARRIRVSTTRPYSSAPSASAARSSRPCLASSSEAGRGEGADGERAGLVDHGVLAPTACSALRVNSPIRCQLAASSSTSSRNATPCSRWWGESRARHFVVELCQPRAPHRSDRGRGSRGSHSSKCRRRGLDRRCGRGARASAPPTHAPRRSAPREALSA